MPEKEEQTTAAFQVQREDGSRFVLTEVATFLVHEGDGHRVPCQIEWFVDGKSVIRDRHVFKNLVTGEIFRMFAEYIVRWIAWSTPHTEDKTITVFAAASLKSL